MRKLADFDLIELWVQSFKGLCLRVSNGFLHDGAFSTAWASGGHDKFAFGLEEGGRPIMNG